MSRDKAGHDISIIFSPEDVEEAIKLITSHDCSPVQHLTAMRIELPQPGPKSFYYFSIAAESLQCSVPPEIDILNLSTQERG